MTVHDAAPEEELNDAVSTMGIFADEGEEQFLSGAMKNEKIKNKLPKLKTSLINTEDVGSTLSRYVITKAYFRIATK